MKDILPGEVFDDINYFDIGIRQIVPYYNLMLDIMVQCIPTTSRRILELGCGTGELTAKLLAKHSDCHIVCVDYSSRMLSFAKKKLKIAGYRERVDLVHQDIGNLNDGLGLTNDKFDSCVASLAIHHLSNSLKQQLFDYIYQSLSSNGCFLMADPVLPESLYMREVYQQARIEWALANNIDTDIIRKKMAQTQPSGHSGHDQLATLDEHIQMLQAAGFQTVAVPWKYFGMAILGGVK